jgi:transposase
MSPVAARTQFRNQLHALLQHPVVIESVQARLERLIAGLDQEITTLEQEIASALGQDAAWAAAAARLATIKGLGTLTIAWVLTTTINFTLTLTPDAAANYAGLAPQMRQSGSSVRGRPRVGHGGNARLRRAVYMASLSAIQHNPVIKAFYSRLRAAGKPRKMALCAAARKLLRIAWRWRPKSRISTQPMLCVWARRRRLREEVARQDGHSHRAESRPHARGACARTSDGQRALAVVLTGAVE